MQAIKDKILDEAKYWVGYLEKKSNAQLENFTANAGSNNYTIFAQWYKENWGENFQAQPWCAMFVSCIFRRALGKDVQESIMPRFHYCPTGVNQFKNLKCWYTNNPKSGDVVLFKDSTGLACHVGIVYAVDSRYVYTIEGNTSTAAGVVANGGSVAKKSYQLGYSGILGYGRPNYIKYENGDELTMTQYEELKGMIAQLTTKVDKLANPMIYNYIDGNMPDWARPTIQKMVNKGFLKGTDAGELGLNDTMLRIFVTLDRAGVYGK